MKGKRAEQFLEDLANLQPQPNVEQCVKDTDYFLKTYAAVFPSTFPSEFEEIQRAHDANDVADVVNTRGRSDDEIRDATRMALWGLAHQLRKIWIEPNPDHKDWYIDELRRWFYFRTEPKRSRQIPAPPPSPSEFQTALLYLKNNADRARRCENPQCRRPYHFTEHRNSRYCSEKCSDWAKREARRRWERKGKKEVKHGTKKTK